MAVLVQVLDLADIHDDEDEMVARCTCVVDGRHADLKCER